ncbi:hypothetical protein A3C87_01480 [Candidatus Kaiserbacteria bacterium RIFCSPHIGHO2_02_FULL_49_34]|uniref:Adenine DNA glycosylase n=1 Tax=Candidatus Kaiserbacteria bacterium RIFCSPHIGHO2_02_FULL_49_34 TaxID=1798491 RepID=A0A1F6DIV1_9BACT|nr:MAG: hypothetical protein A3C87_01480 [Candidatus Kaiserbacteria bacterium RIFCSPHIGHO2_02_FULL_49_34]
MQYITDIPSVDKDRIAALRKTVWAFYRVHGRHNLPWRENHDPYHVWISEIMLQQTQVPRVLEKYVQFMKLFPTVQKLAKAPLADILRAWQGLGYNRRAKLLHLCAQEITTARGGVFPQATSELRALPGIGPYTASAIQAFAFNIGTPLIETNVRTVFIHHFFPHRDAVHDNELMSLIEAALPRGRARDWYAALMDYGTHLKATIGNANKRSRHHTVQSKFQGSDRQLRGKILRTLAEKSATITDLQKLDQSKDRVQTKLQELMREGMLRKEGRRYLLG